MPSVEHRSSKYLNNQAENSHIPTRERERRMKGFRHTGTAQRFLASFSRISPHFRPRRHRMTASANRTEMTNRFTIWYQITGTTLWPRPPAPDTAHTTGMPQLTYHISNLTAPRGHLRTA